MQLAVLASVGRTGPHTTVTTIGVSIINGPLEMRHPTVLTFVHTCASVVGDMSADGGSRGQMCMSMEKIY